MKRLAQVRAALAANVAAKLAPWLARWQALSVRDQRALAVMIVAIVSAASWLLLVSPLLSWQERQEQRHADERAALAWMQANAAAARQAASQGGGASGFNGQSLLSVVNTSARQSALNLQRFEPEGDDRVRVTLEKASFTDVMGWIVDLERRHGVVVSSLTADNQGQPGIVNIRLVLERPAP